MSGSAFPLLLAARFGATLPDIERDIGKRAAHVAAILAVHARAGVRYIGIGNYIGLTRVVASRVVGCLLIPDFYD
jgi:hypothetical protein